MVGWVQVLLVIERGYLMPFLLDLISSSRSTQHIQNYQIKYFITKDYTVGVRCWMLLVNFENAIYFPEINHKILKKITTIYLNSLKSRLVKIRSLLDDFLNQPLFLH